MQNAIDKILLAAFAVPALGACSASDDEGSQNVIITDNVPADADIEALPADEGGTMNDGEGDNAEG